MGRQMLQRHGSLLSRIEQKFGVPPEIVVAIWGLESDFGKGDIGKMPVIRTLATMAHDCRRTELFQGELLAALKIVQRGDLPLRDLIGAFAGEIGQTQFLPSSYIKYGVDFDGNGHVDLRHSVPDVLASTANLLHITGFKGGAPYGEGTREFRSDARVEQGDDLSQDDRVFCGQAGGAVAASQPLEVIERTQSRRASRAERVSQRRSARCGTGVSYAPAHITLPRHVSPRVRQRAGRLKVALHRNLTSPSLAIFSIRFASTAQYVAGRNRCSRSMNRASLPIRMRGWFFSMPVMMRCAAAGGVVLATASKRSIDSARRALSVMPLPVRELRTMLVSDAAGMHHRQFHRAVRHRQLMPQAFRKAAHREFRRAIGGLAGRGDDAEDRGEVDDMRLALLATDAAGTRGCRAPRPRN